MGLPLYLAVTAAEISGAEQLRSPIAWMACHFSPSGKGLCNLPPRLPSGSIIIVNDRCPCKGHDPGLVSAQIAEAAKVQDCSGILLDFMRPSDDEMQAVVQAILSSVRCPVAVTQEYAYNSGAPVFLPPAPLHVPLEAYLKPWSHHEVWLEAALDQELISVTEQGTSYYPQFPPDRLTEGFKDRSLLCRYQTKAADNRIQFTLFDTPQTLSEKLDAAANLGVRQAIGLYQELGNFYRQDPF